MISSDARKLRERGDRLFSEKAVLDRQNQDIALNFYPIRADFTTPRNLGEDFASHLATSYPLLVQRDLHSSIGSLLRPRGKEWFYIKPKGTDTAKHAVNRWLEAARGIQRRAMYDRVTGFNVATNIADGDFVAFGNPVISVEMNYREMALLYRAWHPRDVVWAEDSYGLIDEIHRKWGPTASELVQRFPGKCHGKVVDKANKDPHCQVNVRHIIVSSEIYEGPGKPNGMKWASVYIDCDNEHIIEQKYVRNRMYCIPRWQRIPGSQYAYSPAVLVALPDARLLQSMTLTLLEAGEHAVRPPVVGIGSLIDGAYNLFPGGFTSVDAGFDGKVSDMFHTIAPDSRALPFGVDMAVQVEARLREAFYLNTLSLPPAGAAPEMTAFEVGQRVQEYIRQAIPLFEPMESEYNGELCEMSFDLLMQNGGFGPYEDIPTDLRGGEVDFAFESPLSEMIEREKGQKFMEAQGAIATAMNFDQSAPQVMDFGVTLRDVLTGIGVPAKWLRSEDEVSMAQQANAAAQDTAATLGAMQAGADVANTLGSAAKQFNEAQV